MPTCKLHLYFFIELIPGPGVGLDLVNNYLLKMTGSEIHFARYKNKNKNTEKKAG